GDGLTAEAIAARLNAEGYRPPKRREQFGRQGVQELLRDLGVRAPRRQPQPRDGLGAAEWWVAELAQAIGMPLATLQGWIRRGWVRARQQAGPPRRWIVWADEAEVQRLRRRHRRPAGYYTRRLWVAEGPDCADGEPAIRPA